MGHQNPGSGSAVKSINLKTGRVQCIGLELTLHVLKSQIHLVRQSLSENAPWDERRGRPGRPAPSHCGAWGRQCCEPAGTGHPPGIFTHKLLIG
jgi:hypothetical protein